MGNIRPRILRERGNLTLLLIYFPRGVAFCAPGVDGIKRKKKKKRKLKGKKKKKRMKIISQTTMLTD